jgi:hypothetical protein
MPFTRRVTSIDADPSAEATNHAPFALHMPGPQRNRPEKLDRRAKRRQNDKDGILLGECRFRRSRLIFGGADRIFLT